jgi:hypothetical protein
MRPATPSTSILHHIRLGQRQILWGLGARFSLGDAPAVVSGLTLIRKTDRPTLRFLQDEIGLVLNASLTLGTKLWTPTSPV